MAIRTDDPLGLCSQGQEDLNTRRLASPDCRRLGARSCRTHAFRHDDARRGRDLVSLKASDLFAAGQIKERASITQRKTRHPVRFEPTGGTRKSLTAWLEDPLMLGSEYLWPGRFHERRHISKRKYAPLVRDVGHAVWPRAKCLRHAFVAPNQGRPDRRSRSSVRQKSLPAYRI